MGGAALAVGCSARNHGDWDFLSDGQALTLAALCDRIVPADDFPSASQAGVVSYIDRQLARTYKRHRNTYRDGLEQADAISRVRFGRDLAALSAPQQVEITGAIERQNRKFFELVRSHTLEGYYGSPRHGGNRDAVSWRMLGLAVPPILGRAQYDLRKGPAS
jgi:gluconate 2-dehydrogenase gamma chain